MIPLSFQSHNLTLQVKTFVIFNIKSQAKLIIVSRSGKPGRLFYFEQKNDAFLVDTGVNLC